MASYSSACESAMSVGNIVRRRWRCCRQTCAGSGFGSSASAWSQTSRSPADQRTTAFRPLVDEELAVLEEQMRGYQRDDRLVVLEDDQIIQEWLSMLRVNLAVGRSVISCAMFRLAGRECIRRQRVLLSGHLERWRASGDASWASSRVIIIPWRAGLLYGELFRGEGTSFFWHIGARRNEQTLATEVFHESAPSSKLRSRVHLVCDPMLATGGTQVATIERLIAGGVASEHIIAAAVVAAPEGVDILLSRYPHLRITTCSLDERLDERGYITGPGLGDFGDLAYGDIDERYAEEHWLRTGLLTRPQAEIILGRMRASDPKAAAANSAL